MAYIQDGPPALYAASAMPQFVPFTFLSGGSSLSETVRQSASLNDLQFGITRATVAPRESISYFAPGGVGKAIACASLGAGALVTVGSTNGKLVPIAASSGIYAWAVGVAVHNAQPNDIFAVYISPSLLT
jgi:hypothetical protein